MMQPQRWWPCHHRRGLPDTSGGKHPIPPQYPPPPPPPGADLCEVCSCLKRRGQCQRKGTCAVHAHLAIPSPHGTPLSHRHSLRENLEQSWKKDTRALACKSGGEGERNEEKRHRNKAKGAAQRKAPWEQV